MSVRAGERTQGDLAVIVKAKEMVIYTLRITNNEKNFPKRYRLSVVNKIQDKAFEIVTCLIEAHASRGDTYYVLQEMDCYFYGLFIDYLSEAEKARYEKLKKYNEQRQRAKKRKQEVKNNGKVIKKPTERY